MSAALHDALAMTETMVTRLQADLAVREAANMAHDWRGRTLLWSLQARAQELRAQIRTAALLAGRRGAEVTP